VLVAGSSATVAARSTVGRAAWLTAASDHADIALRGGAESAGPSEADSPRYDRAVDRSVPPPLSITAPARSTTSEDAAARPAAVVPKATAKAESKETASASTSSRYRGRNHVWIPALRIDRSVTGFACSSTAYPGNRVYRWGCAGRNNVYLFGHAHSVFKPLHDAYVRGRLKKGMKVIYADSKGRVTTYAVRWWKVVRPDRGAFAYAAQKTPSLTLQTCVGAKSQYRLIVRLTKSG
jgi:sortase (surface protein transpeptidase)